MASYKQTRFGLVRVESKPKPKKRATRKAKPKAEETVEAPKAE